MIKLFRYLKHVFRCAIRGHKPLPFRSMLRLYGYQDDINRLFNIRMDGINIMSVTPRIIPWKKYGEIEFDEGEKK